MGRRQKGKAEEAAFSRKYDSRMGAGRSQAPGGPSLVGSTSGNRTAHDKFIDVMSGNERSVADWKTQVAPMKTAAADFRTKYYAHKEAQQSEAKRRKRLGR